MAAQTPARFCGHCGAPLAPAAAFCGRCGTPAPMQAAVAQPLYRYPQAPPGAYPRPRQQKLAPAWIAGGMIAVLLVVAVAIGGFAVSQYNHATRTPCTQGCAPKIVTPLAEEASFRSSAFGFQINYLSNWTVRAQDANGVTLGTKLGSVQVTGMSAGSPDAVVQATVSALPSSRWQDVVFVSKLKGAHLGDQEGVGAVYAANLVGASQTTTKVRFAVIAASRGNVTVVVFAVGPADPKNSPNGMPEGQEIDYLCLEFSWSAPA